MNAFTASIPVGERQFLGPITKDAPVALTLTNRELPAICTGVTNAVLRANVAQLNGTTPSCTLLVYVNQ